MWQVIKGGKVPTTVGIAKVPFTSSGEAGRQVGFRQVSKILSTGNGADG